MNSKFLHGLKSSGKMNLVVSIAYFVSMLVSAYFLFTLPHSLVLKGGLPSMDLAWPVVIQLFITVALTFVLGVGAINTAIHSQKERVVYVEKKREDVANATSAEESMASGLSDNTSFKALLTQEKEGIHAMQSGLNALCQQLQAGQGAIYLVSATTRSVELTYGFAVAIGENSSVRFDLGEGLIGQAAVSGKSIYLDEIPQGYITIVSGLGSSYPRYLFIAPIRQGKEVKGVVEIATFAPIAEAQRSRVEELVQLLAENSN